MLNEGPDVWMNNDVRYVVYNFQLSKMLIEGPDVQVNNDGQEICGQCHLF